MIKNRDFRPISDEKGKIFFGGIGGVSMSALAMITKSCGFDVLGYDSSDSESVKGLIGAGIPVYKDFSEKIFDGVKLAVFSAAIKEDSPFFSYPATHGIKVMSRGEYLGEMMKSYPVRIGVSGTHGKSTATAMIASVFLHATKTDPTVLIGAEADIENGNYRVGKGDEFIFEACEYRDSFLKFFPTVAVILNAEYDHADYFPSLDAVIDSFSKFAAIKGCEKAIVNRDSRGAVAAAKKSGADCVYYSLSGDADIHADKIVSNSGFYSFDVIAFGKKYASVSLNVPGLHNVSNALAAAGASFVCGIDGDIFAEGIFLFKGIKRRFEYRGKCNSMTVFDDYAHHPDEIRATLSAARGMGYKKITVVFQSHTFSRTKEYFGDFVTELQKADEVIVSDIYPAREKPIPGVDAKALAQALPNGRYVGDFSEIARFVRSLDRNGILIVMGAGDINLLTPMLLT